MYILIYIYNKLISRQQLDDNKEKMTIRWYQWDNDN